ncbi:unnamed protein product [Tenebrio molitor]|nr:unnamed protein product [Tenebrio molitor]
MEAYTEINLNALHALCLIFIADQFYCQCNFLSFRILKL